MAYNDKSIADEVSGLIEREACIRRLLPVGLINVRALARHLQSKSQLLRGASLDAVISGIRRMPKESFPGEKITREMAANRKISLRNRVAILTLVKSESVRKRLPEFIASLKLDSGDVLRLIEGIDSIKMIIDEHNLGGASKAFGSEGITSTARGMAEIDMTHPPEATKTPGIVAAITTELALNGINLVEVFTCSPEIMFLVGERDAPKAYELLCGLSGVK